MTDETDSPIRLSDEDQQVEDWHHKAAMAFAWEYRTGGWRDRLIREIADLSRGD